MQEGNLRDPSAAKQVAPVDFQAALLTAHQSVTRAEWDHMFARIEELGQVLSDDPTLAKVARYRDAVKSLLETVVRGGLRLDNDVVSDRRGRRKVFSVIQEIDDHLLTLWKTLIEGQQGPLLLLDLIGEIKGLLISLRI